MLLNAIKIYLVMIVWLMCLVLSSIYLFIRGYNALKTEWYIIYDEVKMKIVK